MLKLRHCSAVIFDMDGLVLDSEAGYFSAWQHAAAVMGYALSDSFVQSLSGHSGDHVKEKLFNECGAEFDINIFHQQASLAWHNYVSHHGIAIKQGFAELLSFIQQHRLAFCLATNSRQSNALKCLALAGLGDVFPRIISRDDVQHGKPAPDIFLTAATMLQVPIEQCLVLEDSHAGIVAAKTAGALAVFIPSIHPPAPETIALCDVMLPDLRQVINLLFMSYAT